MPSKLQTADRCGAIDTLKGVAILSVILLHAMPADSLAGSFAWFHIWQAVPIFAVLLGVTGYRTRIAPLRDYYRRRARRLLPAFAVTWLVAVAAGAAFGSLKWDVWVLWGRLPTGGPGNYFLTLMFEFVLVLPLLRAVWRRSPFGTAALAFLLSVGFEVAAKTYGVDGYGYASSMIRYAFAIVLGFWVADGRSVLPLLPVSILYLIAHARGFVVPFFQTAWQPQNVLAFAYPASVVELGLRYIGTGVPLLSRLGQASYHIFLFQIVWYTFGLPLVSLQIGLSTLSAAILSLGVCCGAGTAFHQLDRRFAWPACG